MDIIYWNCSNLSVFLFLFALFVLFFCLKVITKMGLLANFTVHYYIYTFHITYNS